MDVAIIIIVSAKLRKATKTHMNIMFECNLKPFGRVLLFANASISTRKSVHGTRRCGVNQGLHIAIILGICVLE